MIELHSLALKNKGTSVLQDFSWILPDPGRHLLLGSNGSGKTVVSKILTGRLRPLSGHVSLFGEKLYQLFGGFSEPLFYADASIPIDSSESVESFIESELRASGRSMRSINATQNKAKRELDLNPVTPLDKLPLSTFQLLQIILACHNDLPLCVLDGHLTWLDGNALATASRLVSTAVNADNRYILFTASRLAADFPDFDNTYLLSGTLPAAVSELAAAELVDTSVSRIRGESAIRIFYDWDSGSQRILTSGRNFKILSRIDKGIRVELTGSLEDCLKELAEAGVRVMRIDWE